LGRVKRTERRTGKEGDFRKKGEGNAHDHDKPRERTRARNHARPG